MLLPSGSKYQSVINVSLCGNGEPPNCRRGQAFSIDAFTSQLRGDNEQSSFTVDFAYGRSQICSSVVLQPSGRIFTSKMSATYNLRNNF